MTKEMMENSVGVGQQTDTPQASYSETGTKPHKSSKARHRGNHWAARSLLSLFLLALVVLLAYGVAVKNEWLAGPAWLTALTAESANQDAPSLDAQILEDQQAAQLALAQENAAQGAQLQQLVGLLQDQSNRLDQLADQLAVSQTAELRLRQKIGVMQEDIALLKAGKKAEIPADVALALSRLIATSQSKMQMALAGTSETEADYLAQLDAQKAALKEDYGFAKIKEALLSLVRVRDNGMESSDYSVLVDWQFWFLLRMQVEGLQAMLVNPDINPTFVLQQLKSIQTQIDTHPLAQTREELTGLLAVISKGLSE
jgi:hypothetical protein